MKNKEDILVELKQIMAELFELDEADIVPSARLYEELDLDSIDAIDMIVRLQNLIGKKVNPDDFKSARTVQDVIDAVDKLIH